MRSHLSVVSFLACSSVIAQWSPVPTTLPPANMDACMVYDLGAARVLMFGGHANDTWSYDGANWTQLHPAHSPPMNTRRSMVYDLGRSVAVLYGGSPLGSTSNISNDDTWEWNGSDWTQVFPLATPNGLANYGAAYDLLHLRTVVFGGTRNVFLPTVLNTTYEYDGATWTAISTANAPPPREQPAMAYHTALGVAVMFGGIDPQTGGLADTWLYDGIDWRQPPLVGAQPPARKNARMVYDSQRLVCILFGGRDPATEAILNDTWEWNGVAWTEIDAHVYPPRGDFGMTIDMVRNRPVLFGGRIANNGVVDDTWEFGASYSTFGLGCVGSAGRPSLTASAPPKLGGQAVVTLSSLPPASAVAIMVLSLNKTSWAFGSLPMLLDQFGMSGCRIYVRPDVFQVVPASNGTATWTWNTPNNLDLFGKTLYQQGIALDASTNAAGLTVSNAGAGVIGH